MILLAFGLIMGLGLFAPDSAGLIGEVLGQLAGGFFGVMGWLMPVLIVLQALYRIFSKSQDPEWARFFSAALMLSVIAAIFQAGSHEPNEYSHFSIARDMTLFWREGLASVGMSPSTGAYSGGILGGVLGVPLLFVFRKTGTMIILVILALILALVITRLSIASAAHHVVRRTGAAVNSVVETARRYREEREIEREARWIDLGPDETPVSTFHEQNRDPEFGTLRSVLERKDRRKEPTPTVGDVAGKTGTKPAEAWTGFGAVSMDIPQPVQGGRASAAAKLENGVAAPVSNREPAAGVLPTSGIVPTTGAVPTSVVIPAAGVLPTSNIVTTTVDVLRTGSVSKTNAMPETTDMPEPMSVPVTAFEQPCAEVPSAFACKTSAGSNSIGTRLHEPQTDTPVLPELLGSGSGMNRVGAVQAPTFDVRPLETSVPLVEDSATAIPGVSMDVHPSMLGGVQGSPDQEGSANESGSADGDDGASEESIRGANDAETRKPASAAGGEDDDLGWNTTMITDGGDLPIRPYTFPPAELLKRSTESEQNMLRIRNSAQENVQKLEKTLESFGIGVKVIHVAVGPAFTRYELQPAPGIKVSRIVNLTDDIALNLAAAGVRIEAPIPGKAAIGVEIPNTEVAPISLRSVLESPEFLQHPSKLAVAMGKDISGDNVVIDLAKMPHLLIAGATGSGKSVCINSIIISLMYKASPDEVKLLMVDPKVVELGVYNGIPHLLIPVVTDANKAAGALRWAVQEMVTRYKLFAERGVRDLAGYNADIDEAGEGIKLPQMVIIIDELADLMMVAPNDVEDSICRLAQMARAAGMHLVIATQRPSVNVITGVIKANIPSRIAFAVSSQVDSRTIIDMVGAEKLLGKGDMLYYPSGIPKPLRAKGAFISDKEVEAVVEHVKAQMVVRYDEDVIGNINEAGNGDGGKEESDKDNLLNEAIEAVIDCGQASVSFIQRKFKVGYARAGRIIDQMADRGIISGYEGSKPRRVLLSRAQWMEMTLTRAEES